MVRDIYPGDNPDEVKKVTPIHLALTDGKATPLDGDGGQKPIPLPPEPIDGLDGHNAEQMAQWAAAHFPPSQQSAAIAGWEQTHQPQGWDPSWQGQQGT